MPTPTQKNKETNNAELPKKRANYVCGITQFTEVNYDYSSIEIKPRVFERQKLEYSSIDEERSIVQQTQVTTVSLVDQINQDISSSAPLNILFKKLAILGSRPEFSITIKKQINNIYEGEIKKLFPIIIANTEDNRPNFRLTLNMKLQLLNLWQTLHFKMIEYLSTVAKQEYGHQIGVGHIFNADQINTMILSIISKNILIDKDRQYILLCFMKSDKEK
ncbi:hypothetical protein AB837_00068 [bacterium AB1]|nr:hypothetical protein AB837_00068 [bacterium AB1]